MEIMPKKLAVLSKVLHYQKSNVFLFALGGLLAAFFIGLIVHEIRDLKNYALIFFIMYVLCEITLTAVRHFSYRGICLKVSAAILGADLGFFLSFLVISMWLLSKRKKSSRR